MINRVICIICAVILCVAIFSGCSPVVKDDGFVKIGETYDGVKNFSEGFASVKKGDLWGVIDINGNQIVDFIYEDIWYFKEGLCAVKNENGWGFIDTNGNTVIDNIYVSAWYFSEGYAAVRSGNKYGYIDTQSVAVNVY